MRWLISVALRSSADFIRQYTSLMKTRDTVQISIGQGKGSVRSEKENRPILAATRSTDVLMQKGRPILR